MSLTLTLANTIRTFLADKVKNVVPHTFDKTFYFASRQDYAKRANVSYVENMDVQFAMLRLTKYTDLETLVACTNPTTILPYKLTLFQSYKAVRDDDTFSALDLQSVIIQLREDFQTNQIIVANEAVHSDLIPIDEVNENEECKFLIGVRGDWIDFLINVEVH